MFPHELKDTQKTTMNRDSNKTTSQLSPENNVHTRKKDKIIAI
jgi:hypothetical protein